jgi:putative hemolysin
MNLNSAAETAAQRQAARSACTYRLRLGEGAADVQATQALRFEVFNVELNERLIESYDTGLDADPFDAGCDHLLVEESAAGVIGTYRLQTGATARAALGYYSAREFDFTPYEPLRSQIVELGRACIHRDRRNFAVLNLLWKGIAHYARERGGHYLVGCSSITSQDPSVGAAAFQRLMPHLAPLPLRTVPLPAFECALDHVALEPPGIPRLLSAYWRWALRFAGHRQSTASSARSIFSPAWTCVRRPSWRCSGAAGTGSDGGTHRACQQCDRSRNIAARPVCLATRGATQWPVLRRRHRGATIFQFRKAENGDHDDHRFANQAAVSYRGVRAVAGGVCDLVRRVRAPSARMDAWPAVVVAGGHGDECRSCRVATSATSSAVDTRPSSRAGGAGRRTIGAHARTGG